MQVHNDLKTKNILLSDSFDAAKIGAHNLSREVAACEFWCSSTIASQSTQPTCCNTVSVAVALLLAMTSYVG